MWKRGRGIYPSANYERNRYFLVTVQPDIKGTRFRGSNQEIFSSTYENTEIIFVPCPTWKCVSAAISGGMDNFEVSGSHFLQQMSSQ